VFEVILAARAESDIAGAYRYHRSRSPLTAGPWLNHLLAQARTLASNPERCGIAEESARSRVEIRELLVGKKRGAFRVLFVIRASVVSVIHVRRATRGPIPDDELP